MIGVFGGDVQQKFYFWQYEGAMQGKWEGTSQATLHLLTQKLAPELGGTVAEPAMIFQAYWLSNACCVIVVHNHPSGSLKPSAADTEITKKIKAAGEVNGITLLDSMIITSESYYSFADEGLM